MNDNQSRPDQFGRNKRYTVPGNRTPSHSGEAPRKPKAKGHDAVLHALQEGGRNIYITLSSGEKLEGKVVGRDKFTITVLTTSAINETRRVVIYKHAIDSFYGDEPVATPAQVQ